MASGETPARQNQPIEKESQLYPRSDLKNINWSQAPDVVDFTIEDSLQVDRGLENILRDKLDAIVGEKNPYHAQIAKAILAAVGETEDFSPSLIKTGDHYTFETSNGLFLIQVEPNTKGAYRGKYFVKVHEEGNKDRITELKRSGYKELLPDSKKKVSLTARRQWQELIKSDSELISAEEQGGVVNFLKALSGGDDFVASRANRARIWKQMPDEAKQDDKGTLTGKLVKKPKLEGKDSAAQNIEIQKVQMENRQRLRRKNKAIIKYFADLKRAGKDDEVDAILWGTNASADLPKKEGNKAKVAEAPIKPRETAEKSPEINQLRKQLDEAIAIAEEILLPDLAKPKLMAEDVKEEILKERVHIVNQRVNNLYHNAAEIVKNQRSEDEVLFSKNLSELVSYGEILPLDNRIWKSMEPIDKSNQLLTDIMALFKENGGKFRKDEEVYIKNLQTSLTNKNDKAHFLYKQMDPARWQLLVDARDFIAKGAKENGALSREALSDLRVSLVRHAAKTLELFTRYDMNISEKELEQLLVDAYNQTRHSGDDDRLKKEFYILNPKMTAATDKISQKFSGLHARLSSIISQAPQEPKSLPIIPAASRIKEDEKNVYKVESPDIVRKINLPKGVILRARPDQSEYLLATQGGKYLLLPVGGKYVIYDTYKEGNDRIVLQFAEGINSGSVSIEQVLPTIREYEKKGRKPYKSSLTVPRE